MPAYVPMLALLASATVTRAAGAPPPQPSLLPAPTGAASTDPWQQELLRAADLRARHRPLAASALATDLLDQSPPPTVARELQYTLAMALADLDLPVSSRKVLLEMVAEDTTDPVGRAALRALLAPTDPDPARALLVLSTLIPDSVQAEGLPPGPADAIHYTRALGLLDRADLHGARSHLDAVSGSLSGRARALDASLAHQQGDIRGAARALSLAHRHAVETGDTDLSDLTAVSAGRLTYGLAMWDEAAQHYARVAPTRPLWPDAREEQAWALYRAGRKGEALGNAVSLASPWGRQVPTPEMELIKGIARLETCRFDEARVSAEALGTDLQGTIGAIDAWLAVATPSTARDDVLGTPDLSAIAQVTAAVDAGIWRVALRDRDLVAHELHVQALEEELDRIASQKTVWVDRVGADLLQSLQPELDRARTRVGERLITSLHRQRTHLADVRAQADVLAFEAVDGQRRMLQELAANPAPPVTGTGDQLDYAVSTDRVYWPFNGEFWADELDAYRVELPSLCGELASGSVSAPTTWRM